MQTITIDQVIDISNTLTVDWMECNLGIGDEDNLYIAYPSLYKTDLPATFFDAIKYCSSLDDSSKAVFLEGIACDLSCSLEGFQISDYRGML